MLLLFRARRRFRHGGGLAGRRGGRRLGFVGAGARQNALEGVIALMTGVLEDPSLGGTELILAAPRGIPHRRVVHSELVQDAMRADPRKTLRHLELLPGPM